MVAGLQRHVQRRAVGRFIALSHVGQSAHFGMCLAGVWVCTTCRPFKKYRVLGRFWRADWELMRKLLAVGFPISGALMLEWGLFSSAALLVGWIGTTALAAH